MPIRPLYRCACVALGALWLFISTEAVKVDPSLSGLLDGYPQPVVGVTIHLSRTLTGVGFHRTLETEIVRMAPTSIPNSVIVLEHITRDIYFDTDQISSLEEFGGPQMIVSSHMDTEKPATASNNHIVAVYTELNDDRTKVELPIHFRYQAPSSQFKYHTVRIPPPLVLYLFNQEHHSTVELPCNSSSSELCSWALATDTKDSTHHLEASIPCGQKQDTYVVVIVTVLVSIGATIYLTHFMINTINTEHRKKN